MHCIPALGEHHAIEALINDAEADLAEFSVVGPVIYPCQQARPVEPCCQRERNTVLGLVADILGNNCSCK